jgi:hypothetical protein
MFIGRCGTKNNQHLPRRRWNFKRKPVIRGSEGELKCAKHLSGGGKGPEATIAVSGLQLPREDQRTLGCPACSKISFLHFGVPIGTPDLKPREHQSGASRNLHLFCVGTAYRPGWPPTPLQPTSSYWDREVVGRSSVSTSRPIRATMSGTASTSA